MIFALFIIFVFAGIIGFAMFGSQPNTAVPTAQVYAANMSTWHQAAMLQVNADVNSPTAPLPPCPATTVCYSQINDEIWNRGAVPPSEFVNHALYNNWREYQPVVPISPTFGWQSFLIRNISATAQGSGPGNLIGTEAYVLTIFRGFNASTVALPIGSGKGGDSNDNVSLGLANTITERAGLGLLSCSGAGLTGKCQFTRFAPADTAGTDVGLQFPTSTFNAPYFASEPVNILNGRPAMMTRVTAP